MKVHARSMQQQCHSTQPTEAQFTDMVLQFALLHRWRRLHIRPARTLKGWKTPVQGDGKGFPDLLLLRAGQMVVAELKVGKGKTTPEQEAWLAEFRLLPGAAVLVKVWRPEDWREIEETLA